jgi:hypothetical protein
MVKGPILSAVVIILFLASPVLAAVEVSVSVPSEVSGDFTATVDVKGAKDFDTAEFTVVYDSDKVSLENAQPGELTQGASVLLNSDINKVIVNVPGVEGVSGSGSIVTLSFKLKGSSPGTISLEDVLMGDTTGSPIETSGVEVSGDYEIALQAQRGEIEEEERRLEAEEEEEVPLEIPWLWIGSAVVFIAVIGGAVVFIRSRGGVKQAAPVQGPAKTSAPAQMPSKPVQKRKKKKDKYYIPENENY